MKKSSSITVLAYFLSMTCAAQPLLLPEPMHTSPLGPPPYSYIDGPGIKGALPPSEDLLSLFFELQKDVRYGVLSAGSDYWASSRLKPQYAKNIQDITVSKILCPAPRCFLFGKFSTPYWLITANESYEVIDYQLVFGRETRHNESTKKSIRIAFLESWIGDGEGWARLPAQDTKGNYLDFRTTGIFCSFYSGPEEPHQVRIAKDFPFQEYKSMESRTFIRKVEKDGRIVSRPYHEDKSSSSAKCIYDGW